MAQGQIKRSTAPGLYAKRASIYSQCVRVSNPSAILYLAGQVARDEQGNTVGKGDITAQAEQVIANLRLALEAEGATLANMVKVTVYLTDLRMSPLVDQVRLKHFKGDLPVSTLIEVRKLAHPDYLIEIEGVAVVP